MLAVAGSIVSSVGAADAAGDRSKHAEPRERVALPFTCRVEAGRIRLTPSRDRHYAILGPRQEHAVSACSNSSPKVCRTLVAQRFVMSCGGKRLEWADVAAVIGGRRTSQVWSDGRRLNVLVKDLSSRQAVTGCSDGGDRQPAPADRAAPAAGTAGPQPIAARPCPAAPQMHSTHFVMPQRFAPVALFGARIVDPARPLASTLATIPAGNTAEQSGQASPRPPLDGARREQPGGTRAVSEDQSRGQTNAQPKRRMSRALERMILSEPLPDIIAEPRLDIATAPPAMAWTASVRRATGAPSDGDGAGDAGAASSHRQLVVWLLLTSLIAAGGWFGWSRQAAAIGRLQALQLSPWGRQLATVVARLRTVVLSTRGPAAGATYTSDLIDSRVRQVAMAVDRVAATMPLREVLDDELRRVRQRLAAARASDGSGKLGAAAYRVLQRDLDRIERIADSAERSLSGAQPAAGTRLPETVHEAYDTLGIHGNVSDATLKKIADALRMSWHPDLAHDDDDRICREERIKHINIAVELITTERRAVAIPAG